MKLKLVFIALLWIPGLIKAQDIPGWAINFHGGKLLDIATEFPETGLNYQLDGALVIKSDGAKYWHEAYHFPETHIRAIYANYGNNEILGSSYSLLAELHNTRSIGNSWALTWNIGYGFSVFNKPYDAINNPENLVIGARILATPAIGLSLDKQFGDFTYSLTANYRHSSNGHFRVPNIGANVMLIGLGVKFHQDVIAAIPKDSVDVEKKLRYHIGGGVGLHEIEGTIFPADGPLYSVYYSRFQAVKRLNYKSSLHMGVTMNWSEAARRYILNEGLFDGDATGKNIKLVGYFGHEFHFSQIGIYVDLGYNIYDPFRKELIRKEFIESNFMDTHFSNEFGFNFYLKDPVSKPAINGAVNFSLRTIWGKADFFNVGLKLML